MQDLCSAAEDSLIQSNKSINKSLLGNEPKPSSFSDA